VLDSMTPVGTEYHVNGADYGKAVKLAKGKLVYESVNETSIRQAAKELAMAAIGSIASGGGYGPFEKIKRNTWKNTNTSRLVNSDTLATRIAGFYDFMVMEGTVNEGIE